MKRVWPALALVVSCVSAMCSIAFAQTCSIGGHNETSENFNPGGWAIANMSPGTVVGAPSGTHLVISEVAARGAGTGAASDSSEYIEIYNPTTRPVSLDNKYISDDIGYYKVVNGPYPAAQASDWALKFPNGLALAPGRTLVLCVTKAGYFGSGTPPPAAAQYFLEMKDSNANPTDDMVIMTTGSTFPVTGGNLTNPSATNGEWVVLYCWNGVSDLVCDIDYASWGANSASNPKMDKTGISIDGPDAGAAPSPFNADTPAGGQTNLGNGTALTKPNTYQRVGGEVGEVALGGNGCIGRIQPTVITWTPVAGTSNIRFQVRFQNPDDDAPSTQANGQINSQPWGVFLSDYGPIGGFSVPPLQPESFFDVFIEVPLSSLPPPPQKVLGGPGPGPNVASTGGQRLAFDCPPDNNWAGNVDIVWSGPGQSGQVNKHYSDILVCHGGPPSRIHFSGSNCTFPMPWSVAGLCPGFSATLLNEDLSPAPNPVPVGWTGWVAITAAAAVPSGTTCCFTVNFTCNGAPATLDICAIACDCGQHPPQLTSVDWTLTGTTVTFHQHWDNPSGTSTSDPVSGHMNSQDLGVFLSDFGPIGDFNVPAMQPNSFFDVFIDLPLAQLPAEPTIVMPGGGPPPQPPCYPPNWHGNVNINWNGAGGIGQAQYHFSEVPVCPGKGCTYVHIETDCLGAPGAQWQVVGLCPGFTATLVNPDYSPAPNPLPPGWTGFICVQAVAGTPIGTTCCFNVRFLCNGVPGVIQVCARVCDCGPKHPHLAVTDWTKVGPNIRFHMRWENPDGTTPTDPISGTMHSQMFGAFVPDQGTIGDFNVPALAPSSFFDVFLELPENQLPPEPPTELPGGGPPAGTPCPPDTSWSGNVDIQWSGGGANGQTNKHFSQLLVRPGSGSSHLHALIFCGAATGATWSISGLCPGWNATLLNENFTPAPNPVPPGWTGWISVAAGAGVPSGSSCCFSITFLCDGAPGVIDVCAEACLWNTTGVEPDTRGRTFGIYMTTPNPTSAGMLIEYAMPKAGSVQLEVFDLGGHRVRELVNGPVGAGTKTYQWDGRGENGRELAPGAYFIRLRAGELVASKKVVLFH